MAAMANFVVTPLSFLSGVLLLVNAALWALSWRLVRTGYRLKA
jgi:hypothetical protein